MCVVALALNAHPHWRLILIGNRDEVHARPSGPLMRWDDADHVIAGRDLQSGGTWLGVSEHGRLAVVTNVRSPEGPALDMESRGALVADWLYGGDIELDRLGAFNPFNLLVATPNGAQIFSNRPHASVECLEPGIHSLSNGTLNDLWPRRYALEAALADQLRLDNIGPATLFPLLADERVLPDEGCSPIFIRDSVYGTRASTIVLIDDKGAGQILERRFGAGGVPIGESSLRFCWGV
jgi:uncharacterized protein with NRDE domain